MSYVDGAGVGGAFWTSTGTILVLFILLVIISRTIFL
ncbi:sporulation protein YjcZ [Paenibacillus sp. GCM10012307]|nr:sporulation protein YjcZ [Paenibacillus roseus]